LKSTKVGYASIGSKAIKDDSTHMDACHSLYGKEENWATVREVLDRKILYHTAILRQNLG
jgi:hypothetical protein